MAEHGPCWAVLAGITGLIAVVVRDGFLFRAVVKAAAKAFVAELKEQGIVGCSFKGKE